MSAGLNAFTVRPHKPLRSATPILAATAPRRGRLSAFTVRAAPVTPATPYLFLSGFSVIVSLCWLLAEARFAQFHVMVGALVAALALVTFVIVRLERRATRLAAALVGLPEPSDGWTTPEQRAIDGVSDEGVDVAAMFAGGGLEDYIGVTVVLITAQTPTLAALATFSALPWQAFVVVLGLGAVALAALAYAWRADVYLRTRLVPLSERVADTQLGLLSGSA